MNNNNDIKSLLKEEYKEKCSGVVTEVTADIMSIYGDCVVGVFFYGSCLRAGQLDGKVLDFYVIVDDYSNAYNLRWLTVLNWLCPPNVFYHEKEIDGQLYRAKYAVISKKDFIKRCGPGTLNSSIWARFCQPSALQFFRNDAELNEFIGASEAALFTAVSSVLPLYSYIPTSMELWSEIFKRTYAAELRTEREQKALEIYISDQERYDKVTEMIFHELDINSAHIIDHQPPRLPIWKAGIHWWLRQVNGKTVSFIRLVKAAYTFDGGIDYVAWKIKRHSGVEMEVKPWMRRYPLIAGFLLFWRMKSRDAFR